MPSFQPAEMEEITSPPRTIYFVWYYTAWGGAQIFLLAIMKIARPAWNLKVILPRKSAPDLLSYLEQLDVPYEFIESSLDQAPANGVAAKLRRQLNRIKTEIEVYRHLLRYDLRNNILHIETAPWQSWILLTALSMRGANVFLTLHNFLSSASKWRELVWKARMQFVSRLRGVHFIASNLDTKQRMCGWVSEKFWRSVVVAHTCVDPDQIIAAKTDAAQVASIKLRHSIPIDRTIVLAVGQFVDRKGRWIFLEAAKQTLAASPDICFVWLTPELPNENGRTRINSFQLGNSFKMVLSSSLGSERTDVLRFLTVADIFALPSLVEGLPIALLEAMALGIPSISTNVFAIPEAVKDNETGVLIDADDASALASAILELKNDTSKRERLAATGSAFVLKHFDERDAARKCLAAYREALVDGR